MAGDTDIVGGIQNQQASIYLHKTADLDRDKFPDAFDTIIRKTNKQTNKKFHSALGPIYKNAYQEQLQQKIRHRRI